MMSDTLKFNTKAFHLDENARKIFEESRKAILERSKAFRPKRRKIKNI